MIVHNDKYTPDDPGITVERPLMLNLKQFLMMEQEGVLKHFKDSNAAVNSDANSVFSRNILIC